MGSTTKSIIEQFQKDNNWYITGIEACLYNDRRGSGEGRLFTHHTTMRINASLPP